MPKLQTNFYQHRSALAQGVAFDTIYYRRQVTFEQVQVEHYIAKVLTQRLERTNGILRQQTGWTASTTEQVW